MSLFNSPLPPPGSRAIILARYSNDDLQNPLSADDQVRICTDDCRRYGWEVVGTFKDEGKSGRSVKGRTGYSNMMAAAEAEEADVICVFQLDRLGRNSRELHDAKNRSNDVDVVIYTHDKGVMDRLAFAIYAEMAEAESEKIAERTKRGRRAAAERGEFITTIPYGYRAAVELDADGEVVLTRRGTRKRRIEKDPLTAPVVLRVNLDFDAGVSPSAICQALMSEGISAPSGGKMWHVSAVLGIAKTGNGLVRNSIYVGRIVHGEVKVDLDPRTGSERRHKGDVADQIVHDAPWLRIVPQEVWDRNQDRLAQQQPSTLRDRRRPTYMLSGLMKCGVCGGTYEQGASRLGCSLRRVKMCSNSRRVAREDLERVVLEGLAQRLGQASVVAYFIPEYLGSGAQPPLKPMIAASGPWRGWRS